MSFREAGGGDLPRTVNLVEEKEFEGYYLKSKLVESDKLENGKATIHLFQLPDGETVGIWGAGQLDFKLKDIFENAQGALTRIEYLGKGKMKKGKKVLPVHNFKVQYDPEQRVEV